MGATYRLSVHSGEHRRSYCPVSFLLPWSYAEFPAASLTDADTGAAIPCQVSDTPEGAVLSWLIHGLQAHEVQQLIVEPQSQVLPYEGGVHFAKNTDSKTVGVFLHGELFTTYHYGTEWVRPFLHPIIGPNGAKATRSWPVDTSIAGETEDHPHHKSVWVAYGDYSGVDNWSESPGHGFQRHREWLRMESGPVFGRIQVRNDWCNSEEVKQFEEVRDMRFHALPGGVRLFDIAVTFHMSEREITFRDTKEGGIVAVRVATSMDVPQGGHIENGYGGINEEETWGKQAPWCDYNGMVNGHHVGIAILDHDTNPRYPTAWHVRDYGLMAANCFAWSHYRPEAGMHGDMAFEQGSRTTWKYRLYVHEGGAKQSGVNGRFIDFIAPPKIFVE